MKILVIGQGGREHAIAWKIAQSAKVTQVFVAPGNAGTALENKTTNVDINADNLTGLLDFVKENNIDLTIVGPEAPLVDGIVDLFHENNLIILGPNKRAAMLEGSKAFCKQILKSAKIPTADYQEFNNLDAARAYLVNKKFPTVIKADGLAAGKGVSIVHSLAEAETVLNNLLTNKLLGDAGTKIIIEDFLPGQEASFIALVSNNQIIPFVSSQDHKTRDNNDKGPNTGGMGAYSPAPILSKSLNTKIINKIIKPTIDALAAQNITYNGFIYAGLMIDSENNINVLEYNCRLGDPETQVILPRLESDFFDLCYQAATNTLAEDFKIKWTKKPSITVVLASRDYPCTPVVDEVITGLEKLSSSQTHNYSSKDFCKAFHAATKSDSQNYIRTNGGRVLAVTAIAENLSLAKDLAYENVHHISWPSMFYRNDIGVKAL